MSQKLFVKRNKGNFHQTDNQTLQQKLEEEFDNIITEFNRTLKVKDEETTKIVNQVSQIQTKGVGATLTNMAAYNEQIFYGGESITVKKNFSSSTSVLNLTSYQSGDEIEEITVKVETADTGITDFKINDGTNDLVNLPGDVFLAPSVQKPADAMSVEYTTNGNLTLYIAGATTLTGWAKVKIFRRPTVQAGFAL